MENNARGNVEYQRIQSELREVQGTVGVLRQEATNEREAMLCELKVRDEALAARTSVDALELAPPAAAQGSSGLNLTSNFQGDSFPSGVSLGNEHKFAQLPVVHESIRDSGVHSHACCACAPTTTASRLPSSLTGQMHYTHTHKHTALHERSGHESGRIVHSCVSWCSRSKSWKQ
eukprot:3007661-Amphidinium_carterae.6